jgi:hypothetical protein
VCVTPLPRNSEVLHYQTTTKNFAWGEMLDEAKTSFKLQGFSKA